MFKSHNQHTDENDDSHEEVQEVAGTQSVNRPTQGGVVCVIRRLLGICNTHTHAYIHSKADIQM